MSDEARRSAGWDVRTGPRNYVTIVLTQGASTAAAFAVVWVASRALGSAGYGRIVAAQAVAMLGMQFFVHWTALSVTRFGVEEFVRTGSIAVTFWNRSFLLAAKLVLLAATAWWWLPLVARFFSLAEGSALLILAWLTALSLWWHVLQALQAAKLPRLHGALLTLERLLLLAGVGLLYLSGQAGPTTVVGCYVLAPLCLTLVGLWRLRSLIFPARRPTRDELARLLRFSLPLIPTAVVGYLSTSHFDSFFIVKYLGLDSLGRYAVAQQMSGSFMQLPYLAGSLMLPLLVSLGGGAAPLRAVLPTLTLAWSAVCLFITVIGTWLLPFAFGERFRDIAPLLWPLFAVAALAGPPLMGYFPLANARSMTIVVAVNAVVAGAVNIVGDVLLIPTLGLLGCAWATLIAAVASLGATIFQLRSDMAGATPWIIGATLAPLAAALTATRWPGNVSAFVGIAVLVVQCISYRSSIRSAWQVFRRARQGSQPAGPTT